MNDYWDFFAVFMVDWMSILSDIEGSFTIRVCLNKNLLIINQKLYV